MTRTAGTTAIKQVCTSIIFVATCSVITVVATSCGAIDASHTNDGATQNSKKIDPHTYLENTLKIIRKNALRTDKADWKEVDSKCERMCENAVSARDTHEAIRYALAKLTDRKSFLLESSDKQAIDHIEQKLPVKKRLPTKNLLTVPNGAVGFLAFDSKPAQVENIDDVSKVRHQIESLPTNQLKGIIVDLRGVGLRNQWAQLVALGPVLGEGVCGYVHHLNADVPWFYKNGASGVTNGTQDDIKFTIKNNQKTSFAKLPVAVLVDDSTDGANELTAISFEERPKTKFFGQLTNSPSTSNENIELPDGALLSLMTAAGADRSHRVYEKGLLPNVFVESTDTIGGANDKVIQAALRWITTNKVPNSNGSALDYNR